MRKFWIHPYERTVTFSTLTLRGRLKTVVFIEGPTFSSLTSTSHPCYYTCMHQINDQWFHNRSIRMGARHTFNVSHIGSPSKLTLIPFFKGLAKSISNLNQTKLSGFESIGLLYVIKVQFCCNRIGHSLSLIWNRQIKCTESYMW